MGEKRIFKRFRVDIPLKFVIIEENKEGTGRVLDISASGVGLVITPQKLEIGAHLNMWLQMPEKNEPFNISGRVVWLRQVQPVVYRTGIQFDKINFMGMSKVLRANGALRDNGSK